MPSRKRVAGTTPDLGTADLLFEMQGPVAWLTFNRPGERNALTWQMYDGLVRACEWVDGNPDVHVFVLRGAGGEAFAAGTDISQFLEFEEPEDALGYEAKMDRIVGRLESVRCPTIAQVQGYAVGGGMALALACDLRICAPNAKFGVPVARSLGNCLSMANYARLVDALGAALAKEIVFTARMIEAEEALRVGLANEVVPADRLEQRAAEIARTIAGHAPLTLRVTKQAVRLIRDTRRLPAGDDLILTCYMSEDFKEGVRAFTERRKPRWQGR